MANELKIIYQYRFVTRNNVSGIYEVCAKDIVTDKVNANECNTVDIGLDTYQWHE